MSVHARLFLKKNNTIGNNVCNNVFYISSFNFCKCIICNDFKLKIYMGASPIFHYIFYKIFAFCPILGKPKIFFLSGHLILSYAGITIFNTPTKLQPKTLKHEGGVGFLLMPKTKKV